jgi:hypothetical protein
MKNSQLSFSCGHTPILSNSLRGLPFGTICHVLEARNNDLNLKSEVEDTIFSSHFFLTFRIFSVSNIRRYLLFS